MTTFTLITVFRSYYLPWCFAYQIGLIWPCANMRYYVFAGSDFTDAALYVLYWPMIRLNNLTTTNTWGANTIHDRDREPWIMHTDDSDEPESEE